MSHSESLRRYVEPEPGTRARLPRSGSGLGRESERSSRKEKLVFVPDSRYAANMSKLSSAPSNGWLPLESTGQEEKKSIFSPLKWFSPSRPVSQIVDGPPLPPPRTETSRPMLPPPRSDSNRPGSLESPPKRSHTGPLDLEGYFTQAAEESSIRRSVSSLQKNIATHVFNYYSDNPDLPSVDVFRKAVGLDDDDIRLLRAMPDKEAFRLAAIQRAIARSSINKINIDGDPDSTFLPREIVSLLHMVPKHDSSKCEYSIGPPYPEGDANYES